MKQHSDSGSITKNLWLNTAIMTKRLDNSLGDIHGIGSTEYMVLFTLIKAPSHTLRRVDIADALARSVSGITRLLQPMEKNGLVTKDSNERGAKVSLIKLTAAGEELFNNACVTFDAQSQTMLKNLDKENADKLLNLLRMI
ncbi:MarR family winged helix-turn-helix transcriptional regulator [Alteromonas naphthalenivorans]|uniref:MarR family transcriptional regulator n=1 Tax=Alteromonas naphthalenivorans TaxID=715451 RepID=F5Z809_ALTNA|nr:MarR family winged helix-turn-helix transcriptional regulator [Alteromonas naphthalenivorans]AEF03202.1 MarR family transcriptional regulator [Alteromonas naphthalenivorans]